MITAICKHWNIHASRQAVACLGALVCQIVLTSVGTRMTNIDSIFLHALCFPWNVDLRRVQLNMIRTREIHVTQSGQTNNDISL